MRHFGSLIRALRAERDWSQDELARRTGLHANTIRRVERTCPDPDDVNESTRRLLAQGFGLTVDELLGHYRRPPIRQQVGAPDGAIPVINRAPAGQPVDYEHKDLDNGVGDDYISRTGSGVHDPTAFAFVVVGDSMAPEFQDGDTVVCSPDTLIADGDAVFVRFSGERDGTCTFKRVYDRGDRIELMPDNRRYQPMIVDKADVARMAKVVAKWVRYG